MSQTAYLQIESCSTGLGIHVGKRTSSVAPITSMSGQRESLLRELDACISQKGRKLGSENARNRVECLHERGTGTGLRPADGRVPAVRAAEHARAPRGGEGAVARPRLPPQDAAGGQDRRSPRRGGPPDTGAARGQGLEECPSAK